MNNEQEDKSDTERRKMDNVDQLMKANGFYMKNHGRYGTIYYVEKDKFCELYWEYSGVPQFDILINFKPLTTWFGPNKQLMTSAEKETLRNKLITWLNQINTKADIF